MSVYVGVDVHRKRSQVAVVDMLAEIGRQPGLASRHVRTCRGSGISIAKWVAAGVMHAEASTGGSAAAGLCVG